jgi:hypothetical protein
MRTWTGSLLAALIAGSFAFAVPQQADAFGRVGADFMWVPVASEDVHVDQNSAQLGATHRLGSFGASLHANLGFKEFSAGLKLNYFNEGLELESSGNNVRRDQFDINGHLRWGIFETGLGLGVEGGASLSTDYEKVGYNVGLSFEYAIVNWPIAQLNIGIMGQFVTLSPQVDQPLEGNQSVKGILYIGTDIGP